VEAKGPPPVDDIHEFFSWCLYENPMWFEHVASFWEHLGEENVLFVHFNDLQADLDGQMRRVAGIGLYPIPTRPDQLRRRRDRAVDLGLPQRASQPKARGTGLVSHPHRRSKLSQPPQDLAVIRTQPRPSDLACFGVPPTFRIADRIGSASERNRGVGTKIREIQARVP